MKWLGHTMDSVSLIKMDVEVNEWAILDQMLAEEQLSKLPQFLIEWHIFKDSPHRDQLDKIYSDYMRFKNLGFKKFWMRDEGRDHWLPKMHTQAETAYININKGKNSFSETVK